MTHLNIGDKAPDFAGVDQNGEEIKYIDYSGKKVVLFFYPKASTPGCTAEAKNLRDNYEEFKSKGYDVVGVSADSQKRQFNFCAKNELPYKLIADENKEIINAFGVWGPKKLAGREYEGIYRTTFVIDENGIIEDVITKVKTKEHTAQILVKSL
ncbi:MAG: thioredoxin-dependent thiol peroxidase [Flavobacteriales bacterium]|nr:thioredoxin-dependent thiol peroxidase [Flavobacteriales bacterium]